MPAHPGILWCACGAGAQVFLPLIVLPVVIGPVGVLLRAVFASWFQQVDTHTHDRRSYPVVSSRGLFAKARRAEARALLLLGMHRTHVRTLVQ